MPSERWPSEMAELRRRSRVDGRRVRTRARRRRSAAHWPSQASSGTPRHRSRQPRKRAVHGRRLTMARLAGRVCSGHRLPRGSRRRRLRSPGGGRGSVFVVSRTWPATRSDAFGDDQRRRDERVGQAADLAAEAEVDRAQSPRGRSSVRAGIDGLFAVAGGSGRRFGDGPIHELTPRAGTVLPWN